MINVWKSPKVKIILPKFSLWILNLLSIFIKWSYEYNLETKVATMSIIYNLYNETKNLYNFANYFQRQLDFLNSKTVFHFHKSMACVISNATSFQLIFSALENVFFLHMINYCINFELNLKNINTIKRDMYIILLFLLWCQD